MNIKHLLIAPVVLPIIWLARTILDAAMRMRDWSMTREEKRQKEMALKYPYAG